MKICAPDLIGGALKNLYPKIDGVLVVPSGGGDLAAILRGVKDGRIGDSRSKELIFAAQVCESHIHPQVLCPQAGADPIIALGAVMR